MQHSNKKKSEQISSFTYFTPFSLFDHDLLSGPPSFLTKWIFLSCCILNTSNHSTQMDVISRSYLCSLHDPAEMGWKTQERAQHRNVAEPGIVIG